MVANGKPAPDIFLLAAKKMQTSANKCIVIEDSLDGIKGGKSAGMKVFAYVGAQANNNPQYIQQCLTSGADNIFNNMKTYTLP